MQGKQKNQFTLFGSKPLDAMVAADHPLRKIRTYFDLMWAELAPAFDTSYSSVGRPSIPIEVQLRAQLLRALYSIKSERALCEQIEMNAGFRWFVGLDWDGSVFSSAPFLEDILSISLHPRRHRPPSGEEFTSIDLRIVQAYAEA